MIDPMLPEWQFGFRSKRGAADQLLKFYSTLQQQRARGLHVAVLFLDIKKALDRVCRTRLLLDLHAQGIQGKCLQVVANLLSLRSVRVIQERIVSDDFSPEEGTPQGGVCSPLLWNFFFRGVGDTIQKRYARLPSFLRGSGPPELFGFADDAAIVVTGTSKGKVYSLLSEAYAHIRKWCYRNRVELSDSKVKSMYISPSVRSKRFREDSGEAVRCFDYSGNVCIVDEVLEYKYLGALIDHKLSLKSWCLRIRQNIFDRIAFIRRLAACGKLGRERIEKLYKGYVRGYMNYGSLVWSQGSKKEVEMIYAADRKGLRMCCRALLRTSTASLLEESNIESYADTLKRMGLLYSLKLLSCPELASIKLLAEDTGSNSCASLVFQLWMDSNLPITNLDVVDLRKRIVQDLVPRKRSESAKYWSVWKTESLLSRVRMGVLPTKLWAKSMKLDDSDVCRHCKTASESVNHLFGECPALDYTEFKFSNWNTLLDVAKDCQNPSYRKNMMNFAQFVAKERIFKIV